MKPTAFSDRSVFACCTACGANFTFRQWKALPDQGPRPKGGYARRCSRCDGVFACIPALAEHSETIEAGQL